MKISGLLATDKVIRNMKVLYHRHELMDRIDEYYTSKIRSCTALLTIGLLIIIAVFFLRGDELISSDGRILRSSYGKGDRSTDIDFRIYDKDTNTTIHEGTTNVIISEKMYSMEQIEGMIDDFKDILFSQLPGDNESLDHVTGNLSFIKSVEGYPFKVEYSTDNPLVISKSGVINQDNVTDGQMVKISVSISYGDYREETSVYACLYRRGLSREERLENIVSSTLDEADKATLTSDYYILPDEVGGKSIEFFHKNNMGYALVIILIITVAAVYFGKDSELEKEVKMRREELIREYPSFINRFTLFYGAGIPAKLIFTKMCSEYERDIELKNGNNKKGRKDKNGKKDKKDKKGKKAVYEELLVTMARIADGEKEIYAYESFADRIDLPQYRTFVSLLIQAINKGRNDLISVLKKEVEDTFAEKINSSKRMLEEAGTKLLAPMFMMMIVVIIIVMFPAFRSFN